MISVRITILFGAFARVCLATGCTYHMCIAPGAIVSDIDVVAV